MNVVILDDVQSHNAMLANMILQIQEEQDLGYDVVLATTQWEDVVEYSRTPHSSTLYLLDIELNADKNGLDVCRELQESQPGDYFIIASAYPHHSLNCLKCHAFDFLLKPFSQMELRESLLALMREAHVRSSNSVIEIHIGSRIIYLSSDEIIYVEINGKNLCAQTLRGSFVWRSTLAELMHALPEGDFIRIHRNYLVNAHFVEELDLSSDTVLVQGHVLPVSRRMKKNLEGREGR